MTNRIAAAPVEHPLVAQAEDLHVEGVPLGSYTEVVNNTNGILVSFIFHKVTDTSHTRYSASDTAPTPLSWTHCLQSIKLSSRQRYASRVLLYVTLANRFSVTPRAGSLMPLLQRLALESSFQVTASL